MSSKLTDSSKVFPEVGEFVVATVVKVTDYGAYVNLDEYENMEGLLHISEISSSWVKNIHDYVHEREKLVLKVLRVDVDKAHIDLSLRRVNKKEKQEKMLEWKKRRKAESIFEFASRKLGIDPKTFTKQAMSIFEEKFNSAYAGLEEVVEKGEEVASRLKIPKDWAEAIFEVAQQRIKLPTVRIKGNLKLTCDKPDGIDLIKKILIGCKTLRKPRKVKVDVYTVGAPAYVIEVTAKNYKEAEKMLQEIASFALKESKDYGCEGEFKR